MVTADTVFVNGKVVTVDQDFSFQQAVAVKNGWTIDVGANGDIKPYIGPKTQVIDLKGKVILPGACDAHTHGIEVGSKSAVLDCSFPAVKSIPDLQAKLLARSKELPANTWLRADGFAPEKLEEFQKLGRAISRHDLDQVVPDRPVIISVWTKHAILVNSKALELCGIDEHTPDPRSGVMQRDEHGRPTGMFDEGEAMALVTKHVPLWTDDELREFVLIYQKSMVENGYTSYTESAFGPAGNAREYGACGERCIGVYQGLYDQGRLTNRVSICYYTGLDGIQSYDGLLHDLDTMRLPAIEDPNWLNIPTIKLFCDGVHTAHTAWMFDDYVDRPGFHGRSCMPGDSDEVQAEYLHTMIALAHQRGFQVGVHAFGDRAVQASIDGFVKAMQTYPREHPRHYVIHADALGTNNLAKKAANYGIPFSVQPGFGDYFFEPSFGCIGDKAKRMFGLKEFWLYGVVLAGGSDGPLTSPNWRSAVQSAVTRRSQITGNLYAPELAISVADAIRIFTYNGAYQHKMERVRGSIEIGKVADFQVLDQDIFAVDPEEIGNIQVELTMVDGKVVYSK